jgi:anti-sigma factor RsiW
VELLSQYLDGELAPAERDALESHLHRCAHCERVLVSLERTVGALATMRAAARPGLADTIIAAIPSESSHQNGASRRDARRGGTPVLRVVHDIVPPIARPQFGSDRHDEHPRRLGALLSYCLRRTRLRLTLSLALLVGIVLSLVDQGSMIFSGHDALLAICLACAPNFIVPFLAINAALLIAVRLGRPRRPF